MKAVQKVLLGLGLSLFVSSGLYASEGVTTVNGNYCTVGVI